MFLLEFIGHCFGFLVIAYLSKLYIHHRFGRLYQEACKVEIITFVFVVYVGLQFFALLAVVIFFVGVEHRLRSLVREFGPVKMEPASEETSNKKSDNKNQHVQKVNKEKPTKREPSKPSVNEQPKSQEQKFFI